MSLQITHEAIRFFWSKNNVGPLPDQKNVHYQGLDKCWLWSGSLAPDGYGKVKIKDKHTSAHRLSWVIHNGEIPSGMQVLHKCDNRSCVNPNHLVLGTNAENTADRVRKGRSNPAKGNQLPQSKLDECKVRQIREMSRVGMPQSKIAAYFDMCQQAIANVVSRKAWAHIK